MMTLNPLEAIPTLSYMNEEGLLSSACKHRIAAETLIRALRVLMLTRHVDERMFTLQRQGTITFALSSLGEEVCAIAAAAALDMDDWIYPQYRESGVMFWRGSTALQFIHSMFCNKEDPSKGRQMPNHFGSKELNVVTVSSPIGTKIPHAAGAAYAMKLKKEPHVTLAFFGEGATSEGDFHTGINMAAVRHAPCIFFCRNNGYAISTKIACQYRSDGIAPKAVGYGIPVFRVDGNDFFAVHYAVQEAKRICLAGEGPVLIEAMTYRLGAHSTSDDPTVYRTKNEEARWGEKDPLVRLKRYLIKQNLWNEEKDALMKQEIEKEVSLAIEEAKTTANPPLKSLIEDVYFEIPSSLQEQYNELKTFFPDEG